LSACTKGARLRLAEKSDRRQNARLDTVSVIEHQGHLLGATMTTENENENENDIETTASPSASEPAAERPNRKRIRVKTRKRKGKTRVWKTRWVSAYGKKASPTAAKEE
jgi:hypothetical protein